MRTTTEAGAALYVLARALVTAIKAGALQPDRTLTFMWVDEVRGSRQWITSHPDEARGVNTCSRWT